MVRVVEPAFSGTILPFSTRAIEGSATAYSRALWSLLVVTDKAFAVP